MENNQLNKRLNDLKRLDMKYDFQGEQYIGSTEFNTDFNVSVVEIKCDSDDEWNSKIEKC